MTKQTTIAVNTTRILAGLLLVVAGLLKLFVMGQGAVTMMLSGNVLFSWAPGFWAWVLILSEIVFGLCIVLNYKLKLTAIPAMVIILVAAFTVVFNWSNVLKTNWSGFIMHLIVASIYWTYAAYDN